MANQKKISGANTPGWIDPVLQGLAYWIGYKKELYRHHLINEGAIVSEVACLISSKLDAGEVVRCEESYSKIGGHNDKMQKADITISRQDKTIAVIEVKRAEAGSVLIEKDVLKLIEIKENNPGIRCFLLIVSQGKMPGKYVSNKGVSDKIKYPIIDTDYASTAIRVCKSSSSFKEESPKKSNYACLVEVVESI